MKGRSLVGCALVALAASGCGNAAEKSAERMAEDAMRASGASDADVDISEKGMRLESEGDDGRTVIQFSGEEEAPLPEGFPEDVPIPRGAQVMYSTSSESDGMSVALSVEDAPKEVFAFYVEGLGDEGWEIGQKVEMDDFYMVGASKDGREVAVTVTGEGGETVVSLVCPVAR